MQRKNNVIDLQERKNKDFEDRIYNYMMNLLEPDTELDLYEDVEYIEDLDSLIYELQLPLAANDNASFEDDLYLYFNPHDYED